MQKIKDYVKKILAFITEWEILTIPIFIFITMFSYHLIDKVFFTVDTEFKVIPGLEAFYHAIFTVLIWLGFMLVLWAWFKRDSPQSAETMKKGWMRSQVTGIEQSASDHNAELIYAWVKFFAYFFTLLGVAWAVFP